MSAYSPPTRRIPSCSSDYPQCEAKAHTLFPLPSHQIKTQNLSFLKRHRQIFSFRVLKRQFLLPFAQKQMKTLSVFAVALHPEGVDRNICTLCHECVSNRSPSTRRAWIEIYPLRYQYSRTQVALHPEGVDRNFVVVVAVQLFSVALHPEGVDRNKSCVSRKATSRRSPSTRRAWIEIEHPATANKTISGRPPPGGRG